MAFEEVAAEFIGEQHRWDNTVILQAMPPRNGTAFPVSPITIKTTAEEGELIPDLSYRWFGDWTKHHKYGRQFHAKSFVVSTPHGRDAVVAYLCRAPHIGLVIANRLWDEFGTDAISIARTDPKLASEVAGQGFTVHRARAAAKWLSEHEANEDVHAELFGLFDGRGFPGTAVKAALKLWGNRAPEMIRKNPYLAMRISGVGFGRADKLYLDLGGNPVRLKRQVLCLHHQMGVDLAGHTWHPATEAERILGAKITGASVKTLRAVRLGERARLIATRKDEAGKLWLAHAGNAQDERTIARKIWELLDNG